MKTIFEVEGKISTFGGPDDHGMRSDEGLALFPGGEKQMQECGLGGFLLSPTQARAPGMGRRLDPSKYYVACRWPLSLYEWLRHNQVWVEANGSRLAARPVDWGPSAGTHRVADLSPGLTKALELDTDQVCKVTADDDGSIGQPAPNQPAAPVAAGMLQPPNGRAEIEKMFGDPANADGTLNEHWEEQNILRVPPPAPWQLYYQDDTLGVVPVSGISIHRLLADSFRAVLGEIWQTAVQQMGGTPADDQVRQWLHDRRLDQHGGGFNFRVIKRTSHLSLHSYGIAIDWDPDNNPQGSLTSTLPDWWYDIWNRHGWSDGRHFSNPDPMHVQFATGA